jgi:hypothetical protein
VPDRIFLQANIRSLLILLEEIEAGGINEVVVHVSEDDDRTYTVKDILEALSALFIDLTSAPAATLPQLQEEFEHHRLHVYRMVGRLAQIVAELPDRAR